MKLGKFAPLIAIGAAGGIFATGLVTTANAEMGGEVRNVTPEWAQTELTQIQAQELWHKGMDERKESLPASYREENSVPSILTEVIFDENGKELTLVYEQGIVENLLSRYERCVTLKEAEARAPEMLSRIAHDGRGSFSKEKGIDQIMDTTEFFASIDQGAVAENISSAEYELTYMCDLVEGKGGKQ